MSYENVETNRKTFEIVRMNDLTKILSMSRSTILRMVKAKKFPKSVKLGARSVGWSKHEVEIWCRSKFSEH